MTITTHQRNWLTNELDNASDEFVLMSLDMFEDDSMIRIAQKQCRDRKELRLPMKRLEDPVSVPRKLCELKKTIIPAMSKDATRYNLNCIHFDGGHAVATDGHRLHVKANSAHAESRGDGSFQLVKGKLVPFVGDAKFPDWKNVVPSGECVKCIQKSASGH